MAPQYPVFNLVDQNPPLPTSSLRKEKTRGMAELKRMLEELDLQMSIEVSPPDLPRPVSTPVVRSYNILSSTAAPASVINAAIICAGNIPSVSLPWSIPWGQRLC